MPEIFRASPDHYFQAKEPAPVVREFMEEVPNATFAERVVFLRRNFPQRQGRKITWILEGGGATSLYCPGQRAQRDVDIITSTQTMADQFEGSWPYFHARSVEHWLTKRGFKATPDNINYLLWSHVPLHFENGELLVAAPLILAASKLHLYDQKPPRPQDLIDVEMLGVPIARVQKVIEYLAA